jgi:hypothetical protein
MQAPPDTPGRLPWILMAVGVVLFLTGVVGEILIGDITGVPQVTVRQIAEGKIQAESTVDIGPHVRDFTRARIQPADSELWREPEKTNVPGQPDPCQPPLQPTGEVIILGVVYPIYDAGNQDQPARQQQLPVVLVWSPEYATSDTVPTRSLQAESLRAIVLGEPPEKFRKADWLGEWAGEDVVVVKKTPPRVPGFERVAIWLGLLIAAGGVWLRDRRMNASRRGLQRYPDVSLKDESGS